MNKHERIMKAAYELAAQNSYDQISFADVANKADVHWTTVRRYFGGKPEMKSWLAEKQLEMESVPVDTKTQILDAAARIFAKYGYVASTLEQVAADAGMTKGAVYWHFSSKSDLFLELCDRSFSIQLQQLPAQVGSILHSSDPQKALALWFQSEIESCNQADGDRSLLFFEFVSSSREPAVKKKLNHLYAKIFDEIGSIIKMMQKQGRLKMNVNPQALAIMFQALIQGIHLSRIITPEHLQLDLLVSEISQVLWKGIDPINSK